ncbi:MAG TPA: hypothetical protein VLH10_01320, partial [Yinghuangia sp.]|nr:hypothetical protein [Yinghuangia sp.]
MPSDGRPARMVLIGLGPTAADALRALAERFQVIALVRPGDDETTALAAKLDVAVRPGTRIAEIETLVVDESPDAVVVS